MGMLIAAALCASPVVHDGDTIRCAPPGQGQRSERVRIANIDAAELPGSPRCQPRPRPRAWCDYAAGEAARRALAGLLAGRRITIVRQGTDAYGRTLALVYAGPTDAGEWLIARGLARRWN